MCRAADNTIKEGETMAKMSAGAVIYELENALELARDYIRQQDAELSKLRQESEAINELSLKGIKVSPGGLISAQAAAVLLGVKSTNTIYDMMDQHILPEVRVKTNRKVHIDDVRQYILNQRRKAI